MVTSTCHCCTVKDLFHRQRYATPELHHLTVGRHLTNALRHIHHINILHNDVKPDNIAVHIDGQRKKHLILLDFDSATFTTNGRAQSTAGTRAYMSPTRLREEEFDNTSDVASAGLVLCEAIAGRHAFRDWSTVYTNPSNSLKTTTTLVEQILGTSNELKQMITTMITEAMTAERCYQQFADMTTSPARAS